MLRINMYLVPDEEPTANAKPILVETENGITNYAACDTAAEAVANMYAVLTGSFSEKVKYLQSLDKPFFSFECPDMRLTVTDD